MAEAAPKQSESMEDILQSIKRIIEDDGPAETKSEPSAPAAEDVLELTQVMKDDGSITDLPPLPRPGAAASPAPVAPAAAVIPQPVAVAPPPPPPPEPVKPQAAAPVAPPAPPPPAAKPLKMEEGLVSDHAAQAAAAALKPIVEGGHKDFSIPHIPSSSLRNGNTVEDLVLEALKPMLKAWLDEHLPLIVQKIVEKEVRRIVTFHKD